MACRRSCFSITPSCSGHIDHQALAMPGLAFYFCPVHRQYHAILFSEPSIQPLCGECAIIFFHRLPTAQWVPLSDLSAAMSDAELYRLDAERDMDNLLAEVRAARPEVAERSDLMNPGAYWTMPAHDEIPYNDVTYRSISTTLVPHRRSYDMFLLEFCTFSGALAYQPCGKDIDLLGVFKALHPIERNCDPVFKAARDWSCITQAMRDLPRDVR
ncbi:hypothetical protein FALBO_14100 [Fusarium albosuccineum]|uniref:Uncharacterized protein n=1 Tax=Fusarium albosuccineum TaxID=1237068 RepID=A0A8H4L0T0_9HYPO|nr:hypothetical protein FALBO_14100 [Fusarium albosuccineum]